MFNKAKQTASTHRPTTSNASGTIAYDRSNRDKFVALLSTTSGQIKAYSKSEFQPFEQISSVMDALIRSNDSDFIRKAIAYNRRVVGMRTSSHYAAAQAFVKGVANVDFFQAIFQRPDDITEVFAILTALGVKAQKVNSLKRAARNAFNQWDSYTLSKYREEGKSFSLIDMVRLSHPVSSPWNSEALSQLVAGTLRETATANSQLSQIGGDTEAQASIYVKMLDEKKLTVMEIVRNAAKMAAVIDAKTADRVIAILSNAALVKAANIFPIEPFKSIEALEKLPKTAVVAKLLEAFENSLIHFAQYFAPLGRICVVVDKSGSMTTASFIRGSKYNCMDLAIRLAALAWVGNKDNHAVCFGSSAVSSGRPENDFQKCVNALQRNPAGGSTSFQSGIAEARKSGPFGATFVFTDGEANGFSDNYVMNDKGLGQVVVCDLTGNLTVPRIGTQVRVVSGFTQTAMQGLAASANGIDNLEEVLAVDISSFYRDSVAKAKSRWEKVNGTSVLPAVKKVKAQKTVKKVKVVKKAAKKASKSKSL